MLPNSLKAVARKLRRHRDRRFLRAAVAGADALLVSYPKCGRTWVRYTLSNYFAEALNLGMIPDLVTTFQILPNMDRDPVRGIPAFAFPSARPALPQILVSHREYAREEFLDRPALFLIRDPRDVVVSAYFHATRHKHRFAGPIADFILDDAQGLPAFLRYVNGWAAGLADHPHHITSYERMTEDPVNTVRDILIFLDVAVDEVALRHAVAASSFDAMRTKENQEGIPGHDYDRSDTESMRMRKGKAGGYSEYLTASEVALVVQRCRHELSPNARAMIALTGLNLDADMMPAALDPQFA
jgi:Sulfotransferase domain